MAGTQSFFNDKMNIKERFLNAVTFYFGRFTFANILDKEFEMAKEILGIKRSWRVSSRFSNKVFYFNLQETMPESSFIFSNHIPVLDFPAPTFDKIIPIGGFTVKMNEKGSDEKKVKVIVLICTNIKLINIKC